jgi:hypothetical protein
MPRPILLLLLWFLQQAVAGARPLGPLLLLSCWHRHAMRSDRPLLLLLLLLLRGSPRLYCRPAVLLQQYRCCGTVH